MPSAPHTSPTATNSEAIRAIKSMTQQYHVGAHRRVSLIDVRPSKQQRGAPKTKNALNPSETVQPWNNRSAIAW